MKITNRYLVVLTLLVWNISLYAQKPVTLRMGDTAPQFAYSNWIKGTEISKFEADRIYVLEFWATWCLPCIASMPHLSELAEKYKGQIDIIAVNIKERVGDKAYSSVVPTVKDFVRKNADKMRFNVIVDNDDRVMDKQWLDAAGVMGIPATFIVKNKRLVWIGHPNGLEKVLKQLFDGTYDLSSTKAALEKSQTLERSASSEYRKNMFSIDSAVNLKAYEKGIAIAQNIIDKSPKSSYAYRQKILDVMLSHFPESRALEYINAVNDEDKAAGLGLSTFLATKENNYQLLTEAAIKYIEDNKENTTYHLSSLATLYAKLGKYEKAANVQQKVVDILEDANKNGSKVDLTDIIRENKKKVENYRSKLKGSK